MLRLRAYLICVTILVVFSVGVRIPRTISSSGLDYPINMSLQDSRLAVSDRSNGVHIFDVESPVEPVYRLHIPLRGNTGTALKDDILYANEYGALHVIRLGENSYETVKTIESEEIPFFEGVAVDAHGGMWGCGCSGSSSSLEGPASPSTGSSYATFSVIGSYLYYIKYSWIVTMDITEPDNPVETSRVPATGLIETLYPSGGYLFAGGTQGMYIFDLSAPDEPVEIGRVQHFEACDPVVVENKLAYVTLRGGNRCGETRSVLLSVNIEDPSKPVVLAEKSLYTPYGLTVNGDLLYVSSGQFGFGLLDVANPENPSYIKKWTGWPTKDFIWQDNTLFVIGFGDLRIFDVSTPSEPVLLSSFD